MHLINIQQFIKSVIASAAKQPVDLMRINVITSTLSVIYSDVVFASLLLIWF